MTERNNRKEFYDRMAELVEKYTEEGLATQEIVGILEMLLHGICWQEFETAKRKYDEKEEEVAEVDDESPSPDAPEEVETPDSEIWKRMIR